MTIIQLATTRPEEAAAVLGLTLGLPKALCELGVKLIGNREFILMLNGLCFFIESLQPGESPPMLINLNKAFIASARTTLIEVETDGSLRETAKRLFGPKVSLPLTHVAKRIIQPFVTASKPQEGSAKVEVARRIIVNRDSLFNAKKSSLILPQTPEDPLSPKEPRQVAKTLFSAKKRLTTTAPLELRPQSPS